VYRLCPDPAELDYDPGDRTIMSIPPDFTDHAPNRPRPVPTTDGSPAKYSTLDILVEQACDDVDASHLDLRAALQLIAKIAWQEGYAARAAS
jgi:hypothetical protein